MSTDRRRPLSARRRRCRARDFICQVNPIPAHDTTTTSGTVTEYAMPCVHAAPPVASDPRHLRPSSSVRRSLPTSRVVTRRSMVAQIRRRAYRACTGGGAVRYTNLTGETDEYVAAREELRLAELDLADHRERVAALRRALPQGRAVDDYALLEGGEPLGAGADDGHPVRLSELVSGPGRPLDRVPPHVRQAAEDSVSRCAPCGSTDSTGSHATSPRTRTSPSWPPRAWASCAPMGD